MLGEWKGIHCLHLILEGEGAVMLGTLGLVFIDGAKCVSHCSAAYCDEEHPDSPAAKQTVAVCRLNMLVLSQSCCQHKLLLLPSLCVGCVHTNADLNCPVALLNCIFQNLFVQHYRDQKCR